jgi:hypothetical protein
LAHLEILHRSWDIGQWSSCCFWLCDVAHVSEYCCTCFSSNWKRGEGEWPTGLRSLTPRGCIMAVVCQLGVHRPGHGALKAAMPLSSSPPPPFTSYSLCCARRGGGAERQHRRALTEPARYRHRASTQTLPHGAPPQPPLPSPLPRANRVEVRPHWAPPLPWPWPHRSSSSSWVA